MSSVDRQKIRDVPFRFYYLRLRLKSGLLALLLMIWPWFIFHPESFSNTSYHGAGSYIDAFIAPLPPLGRTLVCVALEAYLVFLVVSVYLPMIRYADLVIFDGRCVHGFDTWGSKCAVELRRLDSLAYRSGDWIVSSDRRRVRIPAASLEMSDDSRQALRSMLEDAMR